MASTRNRRGEGERLRGALLDAAVEVLAETGDPARMSVRAVTARAGVSPTALYLHFADRDALIVAVRRRCFDELGARLEVADASADDPLERLRAQGLAYLGFARERPGWYAALFHSGALRPVHALSPDPDHDNLHVFGLLVTAVGRLGHSADEAFEVATVLWMALHGRAAADRALDEFPFPEDERFVALVSRAAADAADG